MKKDADMQTAGAVGQAAYSYWEVDFADGFSIAIKVAGTPTKEEASGWLEADIKAYGEITGLFGPSSREEIEPYYDLSRDDSYPVYQAKSSDAP